MSRNLGWVCGTPIEEFPEPLRSALILSTEHEWDTDHDLIPSPLTMALLDMAQRYVVQKRYRSPGAR